MPKLLDPKSLKEGDLLCFHETRSATPLLFVLLYRLSKSAGDGWVIEPWSEWAEDKGYTFIPDYSWWWTGTRKL